MDLKRFKEISSKFKDKNIAVVGDLMLDVYVWGKASRISQEAPVPVVRSREITRNLGGAANVMRNIVSLGGKVLACGVVGEDENARILLSLLQENNIDSSLIYSDKSRCTIEKQRVIAGNQQIVRIDFEDIHPLEVEIRQQLVDDLTRKIRKSELDAIIFEDYAKGLLCENLLQQITDEAGKAGVVVALDPHPGHNLKIKGLNLMTPNRMEAFGLAGIYCHDPVTDVKKDNYLIQVADQLRELWGPDHLLITLGGLGMALFTPDGEFVHIPTQAKEIFDVSGAGDTVIAAYTIALLGGADGVEAAKIANHAAGIVVGKMGTASVAIDELLENFKVEKDW